jgi:hypothetical protein
MSQLIVVVGALVLEEGSFSLMLGAMLFYQICDVAQVTMTHNKI